MAFTCSINFFALSTARGPKIWLPAVLIILILPSRAHGAPQVPCFFIFGDSLYDNGNNNELSTKLKANYLPYGIDFPQRATGRFTNGRTMADILAEFLGFDSYVPSFAAAKDQEILKGVNYASGGAGILDETAQKNLGTVISLNKQLVNHQITVTAIESILGDKESAADHLSKCLYTVGIGNNDYIDNYLLPQFYRTSGLYTPEQYASVLVEQYSQQLKTLHKYGAMKIALFGIGPLGCTPGNVAIHGTNGSLCVEFINKAVQEFNSRLRSLVVKLNSDLLGAKFIYVDVYGIFSTLIAGVDGFIVNNNPCCEVSNLARDNGVFTCIPGRPPCSKESLNIFWDETHPTEATNLKVSTRSYIAQHPTDTYPMDIRSLAQL